MDGEGIKITSPEGNFKFNPSTTASILDPSTPFNTTLTLLIKVDKSMFWKLAEVGLDLGREWGFDRKEITAVEVKLDAGPRTGKGVDVVKDNFVIGHTVEFVGLSPTGGFKFVGVVDDEGFW